MLPFVIPLATTLASSAYDWWTSRQQGKRADAMQKNNVRPTLAIPESEQRSLASAENQAKMDRLPGQSAIEGRLDQTTANQVAMVERQGIGGATSINAASSAYGMQQNKENELGIAAANMKLNNQQILRDELDENSQWQQKAWEWNVADPYMTKQTAISSLREAQLRNRNTGFKNLVGGLGNTAMMGALGEDGLMGGGDGWFDQIAKTSNPHPKGYSGLMKVDGFQANTQNSTGASNPMAGNEEIQPNYTDKFFQNWASGGRIN